MATSGHAVLTALLIFLGTAHATTTHHDDDVTSLLSYSGLEHAGCLPRDFTPPDHADCVLHGAKGGPALYSTLACLVRHHNITDGTRVHGKNLYHMMDRMSDNIFWRGIQHYAARECESMHVPALMEDAEQHAVYLFWCWRRIQYHDCRMRGMLRLGPHHARTGMDLIQQGDGRCDTSIGRAEHSAEFWHCSNGTDLDWLDIEKGRKWADMFSLTIAAGFNPHVPDDDEMERYDHQMQVLNDVLICTLKATGQVGSHGEVDYQRIQELANGGRTDAHLLMAAQASICRRRGAKTAHQFVVCLERYGPYVCDALRTHNMVRRRGHSKQEMRNVEKALSFEGMKHAGCLPEDFKSPKFRYCIDEDSPGGPALYQALVCIAKEHRILTNNTFHPDCLKDFYNDLSADKSWHFTDNKVSGRSDISVCLETMNKTILTIAEQQSVYLMVCTRQLQMTRCRRHIVRQLSMDAGAPQETHTGEELVIMWQGRCMNRLKHQQSQEGWETCGKKVGVDWKAVMRAATWSQHYTDEVHAGASHYQVHAPTEEEMKRIDHQLALLGNTTACKMHHTGEAREDGTINYQRVLEVINESHGHHVLLQHHQRSVAKHCYEEMKAETAHKFMECWFHMAPDVCLSLNAHQIVLTEGKWLNH